MIKCERVQYGVDNCNFLQLNVILFKTNKEKKRDQMFEKQKL